MGKLKFYDIYDIQEIRRIEILELKRVKVFFKSFCYWNYQYWSNLWFFFILSSNLDGLKSIPTTCSEPMALSRKSSVGTIYIVATDFNPLKI